MTESANCYDNYLTVPKIAKIMNLSDRTIRRYLGNYSRFFEYIEKDNWRQYPKEESIRIIKRINEISAAGKRKAEVMKVLINEFPVKQGVTKTKSELDLSELVLVLKEISERLLSIEQAILKKGKSMRKNSKKSCDTNDSGGF